ncbi:Uncharacterised protein [Enterobacter cloacae]|nr:Uncharacterised protein [Enterobacter cloacae]
MQWKTIDLTLSLLEDGAACASFIRVSSQNV